MPTRSREIRLAARPRGAPVATDFELAEVELPDPGEGEIVVRNAYVSVDPYMRGRMNDTKSYVPPFALGEPLRGGAVGQVVASRNDRWREGTWVQHDLGWREAALLDGRGVRTVDPAVAPVSTALGVLGMTGLTAYVGIVDIGGVGEGERYGRGGVELLCAAAARSCRPKRHADAELAEAQTDARELRPRA